jgi:hypothetical protein
MERRIIINFVFVSWLKSNFLDVFQCRSCGDLPAGRDMCNFPCIPLKALLAKFSASVIF